jgi:soluble lytic murein transglycosylase-like protein
MELGSFLSSAGRIGEGIEKYQTESEQRRLLQQQAALARAELARGEIKRRGEAQLASSDNIGGPPKINLAGVLPVSEPEANLSGLSNVPAAAGAPVIGGAPAAAGLSGAPAPVAAPKPKPKPKPVTLNGVFIPGFSARDPVTYNSFGGDGFALVDPNASDVTRNLVGGRNRTRLNVELKLLAAKVKEPWTSVRKPLSPQDEKRRIEETNRVAAFYGSPTAFEYFSRHPELLAVARANPIEFIRKFVVAHSQRRDEERLARTAPTAAPAVAPTAAEPTMGVRSSARSGQAAAATPRARNFDAQGMQYEATIQQAAARFGINATILKRLIASESSFNPNIVNPQSGALGLAQILPGHIQRGILTDAQARDPAIAINFAAAHLAQNLRNERGDYRNALLKYKGALSQKGIASMAPVVGDITSGLRWDAQQVLAAVGPQLTRTRDPATNASLALRTAAAGGGVAPAEGAQVSSVQNTPVPVRIDPSKYYRANRDATTLDIDTALRDRDKLVAMAKMYQQTGSVDEFRAAQSKIEALDNSLWFLNGMQGLHELTLANDPRRLAAVWSYYAGVPVQLQPQTDGTWNILVDGEVMQRGVARDEVMKAARSSFDKEYVQRESAIAAEQASKYFENQLGISKIAAEALARFTADIQLKLLEGKNAEALEVVKQLDPNGKITTLPGDSGQAILQVQGQTLLIDKGGMTIPNSDLLSSPSARPIAGLPQRTVGVGTGG